MPLDAEVNEDAFCGKLKESRTVVKYLWTWDVQGFSMLNIGQTEGSLGKEWVAFRGLLRDPVKGYYVMGQGSFKTKNARFQGTRN